MLEGLEAEDYDRSYSDRQLVARIARYFQPEARAMAVVAGLAVLSALLDIAFPLLIARGIDRAALAGFGPATWGVAGAILASGGLAWGLNFCRQIATARAVGNVVLRLRHDACAALLDRDLSFFDDHPSGAIVSRVTGDTESFAGVVALVLNLLSQLLLVFLIVGVLFVIDPRLTLLTLLVAPPMVLVALTVRRLARRLARGSQRALALVNANLQEAIAGITVAKGFRQERAIYEAFQPINERHYRVSVRQGFIYNGAYPMLAAVGGLGTALVVYFGGLSALDERVSPGDWLLFVQSIGIFMIPLTVIASFWSQFQQGLAAGERVFALIDADARVVQRDRQTVEGLRGGIAFRKVDFAYGPRQRVLSDFSLTIAAGEMVALVGHSGAGKSTLGKLIARFYEFQGGELLIDGRDIRSFDLRAYRRRLGIVPQSPFLFAGSVADNIRYARPEASDAAVAAVAGRVGGGDWLAALPEGLRTPISEGGWGLALGQRQLVALARTLLQDPAIVILDEATASIDPLTEAQIREGLDLLLRGRTAIVIAHRLSTIQGADRIVVLEGGRIVEEGDHDALLRRGGQYAALYNTYFRHQAPDSQFVPVRADVRASSECGTEL